MFLGDSNLSVNPNDLNNYPPAFSKDEPSSMKPNSFFQPEPEEGPSQNLPNPFKARFDPEEEPSSPSNSIRSSTRQGLSPDQPDLLETLEFHIQSQLLLCNKISL